MWSVFSPVMLSQRIREVMMFPLQENRRSKSGWVICFGKPETYKLAPFIASLLGRAYDTCKLIFLISINVTDFHELCVKMLLCLESLIVF